MLRVLVAEDSPTARELLVAILSSDPGITVVGEAATGEDAVAMARRLRPHVVTMDIRLPGIDGFEATRQIMIEAPVPIVIVSGTYDVRDVEFSMHALRAGALTVLPKPRAADWPHADDACRHLVQTIKAMAQVKVVRRWPTAGPIAAPPPPPVEHGVPAEIVAIATSTGGPAALARILGDLPASFPLPVLIVQHIAAGFVEGLASWLNSAGSLPVRVARNGDVLHPGSVYVAPEDRHLSVSNRLTIALSVSEPLNGFRPSGSVLFESVARTFGRSAVAVILTGMGDDGVAGLSAVRANGGRTIAQDEASSVVFGMPAAAIQSGLADVTLPLDSIATRLQELARL
jgi:two-component system chemotaxis response regulator CheB